MGRDTSSFLSNRWQRWLPKEVIWRRSAERWQAFIEEDKDRQWLPSEEVPMCKYCEWLNQQRATGFRISEFDE
jgi:hypothetical protein